LSLTVSLKFSVLETELNASILAPASPPGNGPVTFKPASMVDNLGKVLVPDTAGLNDNQFGPVALVDHCLTPICHYPSVNGCINPDNATNQPINSNPPKTVTFAAIFKEVHEEY
jgi:hypothetical protein